MALDFPTPPFPITGASPTIALEPADPTGDWFEEHSFLGSEPEHGLVDALRKWLAEHPNEMERIGRLRPDGPLDLTYDHGKKSYPRPDRFDRILVSPGIEVGGYGSRYGDALAAGSDHALLWAELAIG